MSSIQTISKQFALHTKLFNNVLTDIEDIQGAERMNEHVNHLQWIAGHLTSARYSIVPMLGLNAAFPYVEVYRDITQPPPYNRAIDLSIEYPSLTEIKKYWNGLGKDFAEETANLGNEQLSAESPFPVPTGKTFLDLFAFLASHESYHIGQMSIIRKYLGKDAMSYK